MISLATGKKKIIDHSLISFSKRTEIISNDNSQDSSNVRQKSGRKKRRLLRVALWYFIYDINGLIAVKADSVSVPFDTIVAGLIVFWN